MKNLLVLSFILFSFIPIQAYDIFGTASDGDLVVGSGQTYYVDQVQTNVTGDLPPEISTKCEVSGCVNREE